MTLSEFIVSNIELILVEWERYAKSVPSAAGLDTAALRDHAELMLRTMATDMLTSQTSYEQQAKSEGRGLRTEEDTAAEEHAQDRQSSGFSLGEMVSEYRALRASVIRLWVEKLEGVERDALYELTRFNEAIDQALTESTGRYAKRLDDSRDLFLSVLGHDLRSPLGAVLNSSEYLMQSGDLSGPHLKAVAAIFRSGVRIREMISDLLDVTSTRLGSSLPIDPRPIDIRSICDQVTEEARAYHPEHAIGLSTSGGLEGSWDPTRIAQLLGNLVENAIRHGAADRPVMVSANGDAGHVSICVHNEGNPIPASAHRTIFEPMTQLAQARSDGRRTGLGLGLYIARAIADAHGGYLQVRSSEDEGTTFTAYLPRKTSA